MNDIQIRHSGRNFNGWGFTLRLEELSADDLIMLGALRKAKVVREDELRSAVENARDGQLDESLVQSGILTRKQVQELRERGISGIEDVSRTWAPVDEQRTIVEPDIHAQQTVMDMTALDEEAYADTVLTEGGETEYIGGDTTPDIPPDTLVDGEPISPTPTTSPSRDSMAESFGSGSASRSFRTRSMTQEDVENIRKVVKGERKDLIGVTVGGYHIHGRIGGGGMGEVYQATQLSLNREVALKILPPELASRPALIDRFQDEARTLAKFTHSNIVQVYDVDEAEGIHYLTMEQVRGQTLKALIDSKRELDIGVMTNMLKQCVRGLNRALREGIIHRDIKPGNILIDENGEIKIVDFGLAVPLDPGGKRKSEGIVGTPLYMSPEQARGGELTFHSDMYSLGVTFYQLITGMPPFKARNMYELLDMHIHKFPEDPSMHNPELPPKLCQIIMKMMAKQIAERYASYEELFKDVEEFEIESDIIKSHSDFLSDSLLAMGDRGVRNLFVKIGLMSVTAIILLMIAIGINSLMEKAGRFDLVGVIGDLGTIFLVLTYLSITYVALVRKQMVPLYGKVKSWMDAHILFALTSFLLVMIHSGNFLLTFFLIYKGQMLTWDFKGESVQYSKALLPVLNSLVFVFVIVSGLVGRTIWRDIVKQFTTERIKRGQAALAEDNRLTLTVFSQSVFKYWRIMHYPLAVALFILTIAHIITIMYWGGYFF